MSDQKKISGIITKIQAQKKAGRFNVYIDDHYAFAVGEDVLVRYRLLKGSQIDDEVIGQLKKADDLSKIWQRALDYLSFQQRTEKEVLLHLRDKDFAEQDIDAVLARLKDQHLVDDKHYAYSYVRTMRQTGDKGPTVIRQNLKVKGVADALIEAGLADEFDDDVQRTKISELVPKILRQYQREPPKMQQQKTRQRLMVKGFSSDMINAVLSTVKFEMEEETQAELLNRQAAKLWHRYASQVGKKRHQKIWRALYQKGFPVDDINAWLEEQEASEESDASKFPH